VSVARAREINARLRAAGITVHEWAGWETRGNGQSSAYEGCIVHHTATGYGTAPAILVNGRSDLAGPLCNYAGNADGSVTVIAANPANHAGASGGRSMGPLPVTSTFNKRVMGMEIVYPGDQPMTAAQLRTARIWARTVVDVLGYGDPQRARAHAETSITGKWDPGYAAGKTIDMNAFRAGVAAGPQQEDDDVSWDEKSGVKNKEGTYEYSMKDLAVGSNRADWENNDLLKSVVSELVELKAELAELKAAQQNVVDYDQLADKVADRLAAAQAKANADELAQRLQS
jgi:hypothetical protein